MIYKVPASWMKVTRVGRYRIEPCISAGCPREKPNRGDLFYRLSRDGKFISDHGDRAGAVYAAKQATSGKGAGA